MQMPQYGGMAPHMQGAYPFPPQGGGAPYGGLGYAAPPQPYQQHMNFGMQGSYAAPQYSGYGYAPQGFPGGGGPGQYQGQNGSSFGSGKFAGSEAFQRGSAGGSGSPAANGGGRGRGGGNPGRGGKGQLKGTRGTPGPGSGAFGGPGNGVMDPYAPQQPQPAMFTPGGVDQGWGQHGQQASFSKDGKASGQHSGYGAQQYAAPGYGYDNMYAGYPPQQQQPPQGAQQHGGHYGGGFGGQQPVWPTSDKPFGGKGGAY